MRHTRHQITFERKSDQHVIIQASIGIGTNRLMRVTGLSKHQVNYRLHKAKVGMGMDQGFRMAWRNGNHPMLKKIMLVVEAVTRADIERRLVPKYGHPVPKTVKLSEDWGTP